VVGRSDHRPPREFLQSDLRLLANSALLPDERDLQTGRAILLCVKAAAVNIAGAPEQQAAFAIGEVVFDEIRPFLETEATKAFANMLWVS
jgi:hypothetical protein